MHVLNATLLLAVLPYSLATLCTSSNANVFPTSDNSSSGGSSGGSIGGSGGNSDPCAEQCGNDVTCYNTCAGITAEGECDSLTLIDGGECTSEDDPPIKKLKTRDALDCPRSETCYILSDSSLLCLNLDTGDFHDDSGGYGNTETGEYTAADGVATIVTTETGTVTSDPSATPAAASSAITLDSTAATTMAPVTSVVKTSGTPTSAAAASATSNSSSEKRRAGALLGAVGLVAGLVL